MDVIFIEDRKEFDSITRNENLKYVQEHRNTVLLTPSIDIPRDVNKDIKLTDSNVGYSVKYISGSANVYSVGSVWVELNDIDDKIVKDNIKVSLGTTIDYYKNLKVALETENPDEYIAIMHDSLKELSGSLNNKYSEESELYKKDYNFCVRAALFDGLFANYDDSVDEIDIDYLGVASFELEDDHIYYEDISELVSEILYAQDNGDEEEYKSLSDSLAEIDHNHQKYISSPEYKEKNEEKAKNYENYINNLKSIRLKSLEGIKNQNMYYLAHIADFKKIKNNKYRDVLEACENFTTNLFWSTISLDEFLDKSDMEEFFDYNKESERLLVFESGKNLSISKNSIVLVGSNGVGKSLFLDTVYKFLYGGIGNLSLYRHHLENFKNIHLKTTFVSKGMYEREVKIIPIFIENQIFDKEEFIEMFTRVLWESPEQVRLLFSVLDNDPLFQKLNLVQQIDTICSALNQKFDKHDSWNKILGVNGYYKCIEDVYKEIKMYDFYSREYQNLSDGQKRIINIIIFVCFSLLSPKYQKYNSKNIDVYEYLPRITMSMGYEKVHIIPVMPVIIIDEPENSLHPPYVSALLKILNIFCKVNMYGCSIMATHSPIVLQEFTSDMVRIVERAPEGKTVFKRPDFETYGENIGILTDRIFGRDPLNTGFRQTLKDIVNSLPKNELYSPGVREEYIYPKIGVTSLGMEASMVLNGLISSRRKNIELKEKNSEDSR